MTSGEALIDLARRSIRHGLDSGRPLQPDLTSLPEEMRRPGASFITLGRQGELRGCIGTALAYRPLAEDVAENAYAAAFRDPRFPPLKEEEWGDLSLSVSLLSTPEPMRFADEADLLAQLRPGVDGLIIEDGAARALFLPSVWEQLPEPRAFLAYLKRKAGLSESHWSPGFRAHRFVAEKIGGGL